MKQTEKSLLFVLLASMLAMAMLLSSCEEIIYEELLVEKIIKKDSLITKTDTLVINKTDTVFIDKMLLRVDTIKMDVITTDVDTVFQVITDSVFIYTTLYDTIYITQLEHVYHDTLYVFPGRTVYSVPEPVQDIVNSFWEKCAEENILVTGGNLFVDYWPLSDFPPANRSSRNFSVWTNGQWVIQVIETLPQQYWAPALFRELAHSQLNKPYTNGPGLMNPAFDNRSVEYGSEEWNELVDQLFAN